jgi:hypothetical protein
MSADANIHLREKEQHKATRKENTACSIAGESPELGSFTALCACPAEYLPQDAVSHMKNGSLNTQFTSTSQSTPGRGVLCEDEIFEMCWRQLKERRKDE